MNITTFRSDFEKEVCEGLTSFPKHLSSKYFYDKTGDGIFQEIMQLPEYYLTRCEFDILQNHKAEIAAAFDADKTGFDLIELGAGDGKKTKILLRYLAENNYNLSYFPIDISENVLQQLAAALKTEIPELTVKPQQGTYFGVLERLSSYNKRKKVILFLGSNIGNLLHKQAVDFLQRIKNTMNDGDLLFIGFDQKKDPQLILDAYNDKTGITERFNKNILKRINKELQADFNPDNFLHWETYDPETGTAKSFLVAKNTHTVAIDALDIDVQFKQWETIHTEISQKYDDEVVNWLANEAGLTVQHYFSDTKNYYKNYIFTKKNKTMKAIWNNTVIAESNDTVVVENNHYFPYESIKKDYFKPSNTHTTCPWKGVASYYTIEVDGKENKDAAWYYPETSELAKGIKNRVAFWKGVEVIQ